MGILDNIKKEADGDIIKKQSPEERDLEVKLNRLFYLDKNIDKELEFLEHVMTRGQETAERKGLHASALIAGDDSFCYRQQVLSLFYKQKQGEQISPGLKRIFSEGDAIHEKWQRLFIRGGYAHPLDCDNTQIDRTHGFEISFTPDILCEIDGVAYVGEIKSVNTHQFTKLVRDNLPHPSGKKQLFFYMYLLGIHKGFVLCEDKNTQQFKVDIYDYDYEEIKQYVLRLPRIREYVERLQKKGRLVKRIDKCIMGTDKYRQKVKNSCYMCDVCFGKCKELL